jgi:hypothetical protein
MNELQFCYWLQGFFELSNPKTLDENQVQEIKNHLNLVFKKVTPVLEPSYCSPDHSNLGYHKLFTGHTGVSATPLC